MKTSAFRHCGMILRLSLLLASGFARAEEAEVDDLVRKLRGQAGQARAGGLATRGMKSRSLNAGGVASAPVKETRSLLLSRGVPKAVTVAAEEDTVALKPSGGDAVELSYEVDPKSEVSKDNIFFRKGTAEFADDRSVAEVVTLADALKHPELKGLKYVIEGHASAEGDDDGNLALSQERAERIVSVLTRLGVEPERLVPVGFGESKARFTANDGEALLKQDRRVLIFRFDR
jgi:outer membrane protein OmpA-like peptidoglycan-associated protein